MKRNLPDILLSQLSNYIASYLALYFPKDRWDDLERHISSAAIEFGYPDVEKFINHLISSPLTRDHAEMLASHLTINETYFWREPQSFEILEQKILPELIQIRQQEEKRIRIWSAGCSGGEEPYSIAIALRRNIPDIGKWNISILASDISTKILQKAVAGVYSQWSFRSSPGWLKEKYFTEQEKGKFEIVRLVKNMVSFDYLNLAEDVFPSPVNHTNAMDIIFCRNVLMYFTADRVKQIIGGFYNALVDGGYLIVGGSELFYQNYPQFEPVNFAGAIVYRKKRVGELHKTTPLIFDFSPKIDFVENKLEPLGETVKIVEPPKSAMIEQKAVAEIKVPKKSRYEEARQLYSRGYYSEVIAQFSDFAKTTEELKLLIRAHANQGKLSAAVTLCEKAITANKLDHSIYYLQATILQEQNQDEQAIASLRRTMYLDPDFVLAYYSLGNILLHQGNLAGAKKNYRNVLSILEKFQQDDIIPESEGLTAGRLKEIINTTIKTNDL